MRKAKRSYMKLDNMLNQIKLQIQLLQISIKFQDTQEALSLLENARWKEGVICTKCKSKNVMLHQAPGNVKWGWRCKDCFRVFTITDGTIFFSTQIPFYKWYMMLFIILYSNKKLSLVHVGQDLELQNMAVRMMIKKIQNSTEEQFELLADIFKAVETEIMNVNVANLNEKYFKKHEILNCNVEIIKLLKIKLKTIYTRKNEIKKQSV